MGKLLVGLPEVGNAANVRGEQAAQIGSESVNKEILMTLGKRVPARVRQADADGIVVTPDTDTLEETACFTNLVIRTSKSMGVVGCRRPGTALSANGAPNLFYAPVWPPATTRPSKAGGARSAWWSRATMTGSAHPPNATRPSQRSISTISRRRHRQRLGGGSCPVAARHSRPGHPGNLFIARTCRFCAAQRRAAR